MNILKVNHLFKKIGTKDILKDVSFELNSGDILAFIGPNGAGKTTTIKCILGLQKMTSGQVFINGFDIEKDFVHAIQKVGCLVEAPDVYLQFSGYENLKMKSMYYKDIKEERLIEVIKLVGLENRIHDKVSTYSLGMRQRLGIAMALIHEPNLLILDEPTNGLDPEGIKDLRDLFVNLAKQGIAIFISSHNLSELENFCNKVCILSNGQILETNNMDKVKSEKYSKYILKVEDTSKINDYFPDKIIDKNYFEVTKSEEQIKELIERLVMNHIALYEVKKEEQRLEDVYLNKVGGNKIG